MRISQYKKAHRDILFELVYDDANGISEPFKIVRDIRDQSLSYVGSNISLNDITRQFFFVDRLQRKVAKIDPQQYTFLNVTDHPSQGMLRHDRLNIYFPSNFEFGEYRGFYVRIFTFDFETRKTHDISNYFYDKLDSDTSVKSAFNPPLLYESRLWDSKIELNIPSVDAVSLQLASGLPIPNSVNQLLTDGRGLSLTSPIFIDFHFITGKQTVGSLINYIVSEPLSYEFPRIPELEEVDILIKESDVGDFFEIYPIYNQSVEDFQNFVVQSRNINKFYQVEFKITLFEQNRKGKTITILKADDFTQAVEYRPIIRTSTSTAIIDVEMKLIELVEEKIVTRKSFYGMKPDQVSKYSFKHQSIKVRNIHKPKIYVKKQNQLAQVDAITRKDPQLLKVKIDRPTLKTLDFIHASSENMLNKRRAKNINNFYPLGELKIVIGPFDNIIKFRIANIIDNKLDFIDLSNCDALRLIFRSNDKQLAYAFAPRPNTDVSTGMCSFIVPQKAYNDIKKMYNEMSRFFYITTTNKGVETLIYSGLFIPEELAPVEDQNIDLVPVITPDTDNNEINNTAIVTRRTVLLNQPDNTITPSDIKEVNRFERVGIKLDPRIK